MRERVTLRSVLLTNTCDEELAVWARRIGEQPWSDAFVFLKHEEEGKGPKLAARLIELLK